MKKKLIIILFLVSGVNLCEAQLGSYTGGFSRMGFTTRGLGMSNAMVSDIFGQTSGIYNPALAVFMKESKVDLSYTFLSFDRKLNFLGFTTKIKLPQQKEGAAGITAAWLNSGVGDIDGRDNDTRQIGMLSTFDNEFYFGTGFLLSEKLSLGVGFKLYYSQLFEDVSTTSFALDFGGIYKVNNNLALGLTIIDVGAKYEWQTSQLYGSNGNTTKDKFPVVLNLGGSYLLPNELGIASLALQQYFNPDFSSSQTDTVISSNTEASNNTVLRFGFEINVVKQIKVRAGLDRIDFSAEDFAGNLKPSFGLAVDKSFSKSVNLGFDYALQIEPFSSDIIQNIGLVFKFK
ncbi:MAG TPA: hypothetical protein PKD83_06105 [Ignavibacteria bacterium]|nr:hypothetical protein [Ignavibacteria bacterium]